MRRFIVGPNVVPAGAGARDTILARLTDGTPITGPTRVTWTTDNVSVATVVDVDNK